MSGTAALILGPLAGLVTGATIAWAIAAARGRRRADTLIQTEARAELLERRLEEVGGEAIVARDRGNVAEQNAAALTAKLEAAERREREQAEARDAMTASFRALGAEALQANNAQFMSLARTAFQGLLTEARGDAEKRQQVMGTLMGGVKELLEKQGKSLTDIERKRAEDRSGMEERLKQIAADHARLGTATDQLVSALRRPNQLGRWGEMQLRNVVELAGMTEHCDFDVQTTMRTEDAHIRPDMVVRMPGGGRIVIDAKSPMEAYLAALEPENDRDEQLRQHARNMATHLRQLSAKRYWEQFERTPKLVVMFIPLESSLIAALETSPSLHAEAMKQHVLLASPTLLVALLRAIAYGWQQEDVAANARQIAKSGRVLYERIGKFVDHLGKVGDGLRSASNAYNRAVGSMESRLLPSARELRGLHVSTEPEPDALPPVLTELREIKPVVESETGVERDVPSAAELPVRSAPDTQ